jgi:cold shock CspA family protein
MKGTILWYDKEKELGIARTHQHKRILVSIYDVQNSNFLIAGDEIEMEIEDKILCFAASHNSNI